MVYHPKTIRLLAIAQMVIGALCIVFGISIFFVVTNWRLQFIQDGGFGLWAGAWILATGLLGFFGSRDRQLPNKCLLGTFLGFAITSCVMAGIMLISYAVALSYVSRYNRHSYNWYSDNYNRHFDVSGAAGLSAMFLIISIVEFFVALASCIYCCNAVCSSVTATMPTQQVLYIQPGMGQIQGGVVMIAPGTTGAVMQPVQGQGQYMVQQPVQGQGQYVVQQPVQPGYWNVPQQGVTTAYNPANQTQATGYPVASGMAQPGLAAQPNQQNFYKGPDAPPAYNIAAE